MQKKWLIASPLPQHTIKQFPEIAPLVLQLLYNRGLQDQRSIDEFLHPDYSQDIHDPFLFTDMGKAVDRIYQAIEKGEAITVHGDYDADGVCASVIMVSVLQALGAEVNVYIPHRLSEGYGLNQDTVQELKQNGTRLIVTVDCGIASVDEIALANKEGIDTIITDHHEAQPELPDAFATINPHLPGEKYPFCDLAGAGVAFKLASAIIAKDNGKKLPKGFEKWLLDLVAIGTIGDCVPLLGENRTLVQYGMIVLRKTKRVGLRKMVELTRFNQGTLDTNSVAFGIVPRINAAGRIDHANTAYELLLTVDEERAQELATCLEATNKQRQEITEQIVKEAKQQIDEIDKQKILFARGKEWTVGIVGLVAGRLAEAYHRPVIIMGENEKGDIVGSGRSISGFDITKALIDIKDVLEQFGGHAAACGFTLRKNKYQKFIKLMEQQADKSLTEQDLIKKVMVDSRVPLEDINWDLVHMLQMFEPFGERNPIPTFAAFGLEVIDMQKVGNEGKHLRLVLRRGNQTRKVIAFRFGNGLGDILRIGDMVDIIFEVSVNEWNGNRELQLKLIDVRIDEGTASN